MTKQQTPFERTINGWRVPASVARLTPEQMLERLNGIKCGEWSCPNCGTVATGADYPATLCSGCGLATFPRRCTTRGCGELCQPLTHTTERGGVLYYDPPTYCKQCTQQASRKQRSTWCDSITPPDIYQGAITYDKGRHGRRQLDDRLSWWLCEDQCGTHSRSTMLYVYGKHGTGKSVGVMAHAIRGHIRGIVRGLWYASEPNVEDMARGTYADSEEMKAKSRAGFYKCSTTDLLILDSAGSKQGAYPKSVRGAYERILSDRLRRMMPTIVISTRSPFSYNGQLSAFDWLDESIASQFTQTGIAIEVTA